MILSAGFERKFNKKLITCSIFPQEGGKPVVNPSGKYCIRLHINGCWRRILIDTHLPYGSHDRKLCSYSADHSELWVSLIEKAYMKARDLRPLSFSWFVGFGDPWQRSWVDMISLGVIPVLILML